MLRTTFQTSTTKDSHQDVTSEPRSNASPNDALEHLLAAMREAEEEVFSQNNDLGLLDELSNQVGSTLQLDDVLQVALKQAKSALQADVSWCYLMQNGMLTLHKHDGLSER